MKDMNAQTASLGILSREKTKDDTKLAYGLDLDRILAAIIANPELLNPFTRWANEAMVNRGGNRWKALEGKTDGTDWFLAELAEDSGSSRFKGNDNDRKSGAELLDMLTKAGKLADWEAKHGVEPTLENLTRIFTRKREIEAREAEEKKARLMREMTA